MYKKIVIILLLCFAVCGVSYGQSTKLLGCGSKVDPEQVAFGAGEWIKYTVAYSAPMITAQVADITFTTVEEKYMGRDCFKVEARGVTRPFYSIFFPLDDVYTTWLERSTLMPVKATSNLHEGNYRFRTALDFHYKTLSVRTEGHDLRRNTMRRHFMRLDNCSYDALGLFYNMRSADLRLLANGQSQALSMVLEDTVRNVYFRFIGRETKKIKELGSFRTLKFACKFATSNDESFTNGAEFFLWLSDDENRIPIYLESPIKVGKVFASLSAWSGLKAQFSSFIIAP
ncbi:MAG: DUF3108 domain-containing protein [Mucinivorans sp.]